MVEKRGRPSRRQLDEQSGNIVWQRLAEVAAEYGLDPRITSQIGRLRIRKLLSDTQAAAGDLIGRVYGRYERLHGKRRVCCSPSYEFSTGAGRDGARDRSEDPDWVAQVEADYRRLQDCIPTFPRDVRGAIEELCVENRAISGAQLNAAYAVLNRVSVEFELGPVPAESSALAPARKQKPRVSRQERFEQGAYALSRDAQSLPSRFHTPGSAAARDHATTVRRIEQANARRAGNETETETESETETT
jgi:hypothetical protein